MQRFIVLLIIAALGWYGYTQYQSHLKVQAAIGAEVPLPPSHGRHDFQMPRAPVIRRLNAMAEPTVRK
jgi:hypothetical protein